MDLTGLLKALDDLLYEIMSWLVFYPITLWRVVRHPSAMMVYANVELKDVASEQFTETLNPPVFLLVTLLVAQSVELELIGDSPLLASNAGLAALIDDDSSLILFRLAVFSVFPVIMAARLVRLQRIGINRKTLEPPFYAQCYAAAPLGLALSLGSALVQVPWIGALIAGHALQAGALLWYLAIQTDWFARNLGISRWKGLANGGIALSECLLFQAVLWMLLGGSPV
jgi:hypothetical protein